jgi:hypothetical protein
MRLYSYEALHIEAYIYSLRLTQFQLEGMAADGCLRTADRKYKKGNNNICISRSALDF